MTDIISVQPINGEIVLTERLATSEFFISEIQESIINRVVRVEVELGPFTVDTRPNGDIIKRGASRRGLVVWEGDEYATIMDTWDNVALITKVTELLSAQAVPVTP